MSEECRNAQDPSAPPGCLKTVDPKYTMDFSDIGQPPIHWCSFCGPLAAAMNDALTGALESRGPEFQREAEKAITEAESSPLQHH